VSVTARYLCSLPFEELREGEEIRTHGRTIGEFDLTAFGALTGDCAPQHLDHTFGATGPFGGRIAHGALVISYALGLVPIDPDRLIALRGLRDITFKAPVRIGDTIHVVARVGSLTPLDDECGVVELIARVVNQADKSVARMKMDVVWRRAGA
jgi:acyl dehydratase